MLTKDEIAVWANRGSDENHAQLQDTINNLP
jgi:hypothetical protein